MRHLAGLRSPGFAIAAAGLMAIGIAAATLTFTNALLLRPLPVHAPERQVRIVTRCAARRKCFRASPPRRN